ncbi:lysine--tRNA ligase [Cyanobacterium aponinum UTEX 3222]|uniref:Lysine--tRNA ligase n=1 Tax=Cyanobacterium aponinum (strain PCC 10605) TaxID=755178 RepID=K9Z688_CYAAP|nr:lysine--tRNA ligase [Cyanobacterium aponinum]AFZ54247.1 lysyl-tRNA synthetase [Cyanobacterium aponinum PCC 10605]MBD2393854.1 lysine--tRNA ligase [Cyanobacterium aponinum FACHB-4101]WRL37436.1 lysine--tRNA ligase [Cyanobacterium aponinum UTEX 3221]WRL43798.1 lysine--tRNA ligase [Cyanobacterium aponinum UTEX 3222]
MFWADKIAASSHQEELVNDSKTPSGRVHVGSVRGVIIHDVMYRALKRAGKPVKFTYGVDDYDALDTVPHYLDKEKFSPYLGYPLCNVPSPDENAPDYAKYFMGEFLEVFEYLGVKAEIYYLRDLYRSGKLNPYIDKFLNHAQDVREVYRDVSKADRADNWYPFQVICPNCGKIATTNVTDYNGSEVFFTCKEDATDWVKGCGHQGWISPFDGNGKLPWKVEWVAKWDLVGVTMEMAGKDHSQKGGSRDVANAICRKVLHKKPPFHSPYEFILVNGTKMSSSKGVGSSAKDMADLLPPELLRFLMLRTQPKTVINFAPNYETITRLFRDYDNLLNQYAQLQKENENVELDRTLLPLFYAQLEEEIKPYYTFDISTLISLLQVPHLDLKAEIEKRAETELTDYDWEKINERIAVAKKWLEDYADEEEKLVIYFDNIPETASGLSDEQKQYLTKLKENLIALEKWEGEELQTALFTATKQLGISPSVAFPAIYYSFLGKERGPKAGYLFSYLDKDFVLKRLEEVVK